jgi:hypothetical protein
VLRELARAGCFAGICALAVGGWPDASAAALAPWALPAPTGSARIGTVSLYLVDRARWDPFAPVRRHRALMISLWYPAASSQTQAAANYVDAKIANILDRDLDAPLGAFEAVRTQAIEGPPMLVPGRAPYPVVLYSPGFGSWRNASTSLVEELASRGFVVVTIDHPYDAIAVEFPNGEVVKARPLHPSGSSKGMTPLRQWDTLVGPLLKVRVADVRFVLGVLAAIDSGHNPAVGGRPLPQHLAGALDMTRIGMFGHSLGGSTTAEVMQLDRRVRAGFLMDGPIPSETRGTRFDRSLLLLRSGDKAIGELVGPAWQQFLPRTSGWHRMIKLAGAGHNDFTDLTVVARRLGLPAGLRSSWSLGSIDAFRAVRDERGYLVEFFDRQLRGRP